MATDTLTSPEESRLDLMEEGLVSVRKGGEFLGYGHTKMYQLMDSGALPYVHFGKSRRIPVRALKELAAQDLRSA